MATYDDARKARKRANERYRYLRKKYDIDIPYDELKTHLPIVEKGLAPMEYDNLIEMFDNITKEDLESIIIDDYLEPEDETSPYEMTYYEDFSSRLHDVDYMIGEQFDNMINYINDYTGFTPSDIEGILESCEDYIELIEQMYEMYESKQNGRTRENSYHASINTLNKMMKEMFHVYIS